MTCVLGVGGLCQVLPALVHRSLFLLVLTPACPAPLRCRPVSLGSEADPLPPRIFVPDASHCSSLSQHSLHVVLPFSSSSYHLKRDHRVFVLAAVTSRVLFLLFLPSHSTFGIVLVAAVLGRLLSLSLSLSYLP